MSNSDTLGKSVYSRLYHKLNKLKYSILIKLSNKTQLETMLMTIPYGDLRILIWRMLGNTAEEDVKINKLTVIVGPSDGNTRVILHKRVALGPHVCFIKRSSPNNSIIGRDQRYGTYLREGSIEVGEDTWIGANVTIMPGISIGKRCIVGAGSVVTKEIPDDSLAYGNPVRIRRCLLDD